MSHAQRAALAGFAGTTIEFYDFYIFGMASAVIFGEIFFPNLDAFQATLASFATFSVGFVARPLSGMVFGHFGDRFGRKAMLLLTMCLMGAATTAIGLLPSYAQIGLWAPTLLIFLRIVQGVAIGGEWGGAVLIASEHAPLHRKTLFASFPQMGSPAGLILALLAFRGVTALDHEALVSWGWRLPFLASFVLLVLGMIVRTKVVESPEFELTARSGQIARFPLAEVLRNAWRPILLAAGAMMIGTAGFYFTNVFMISYVTAYLGINKSTILDVLLIVTFIQFCSQPISALLAERYGDVRFLVSSAIVSMISPYPMFMLVKTQQPVAMVIGISLAVVPLSAVYAVMAGFMVRSFQTRVRYTAISVAYQSCCALTGGVTPLIGTMIANNFKGEWLPLAVYFSVLACISLVSILALRRYQERDRYLSISIQAEALAN